MENQFEMLKKGLLSNLRIYQWIIAVSILVIIGLIYLAIFCSKQYESLTKIGGPVSFLISGINIIGFMNFKNKIKIHDILVMQYVEAQPPKDAIVNNIIENSKITLLKG